MEVFVDTIALQTRPQTDLLFIGSFALLFTATLLAMILSEIHRRSMDPICPLLFAFWLMVTLAYAVRLYGNIIRFVIHSKSELGFEFLFVSGIIFLLFMFNLVNECFPRHSTDKLLEKNKTRCPEEYASLLSKLTYLWLDNFIYLWYKESMTEETSFDLRQEDKCKRNTNMIEKIFLKQISAAEEKEIVETVPETISKSSKQILETAEYIKISSRKILLLSLMKGFGLKLVLAWSLKVISDLAIYTMPVLLKFLLKAIEKGNMPNLMGYLFALAFLFCGTISRLSANYCLFITTSVGIRVRAALIGMIYRKTLRLSCEACNKLTSGEITNLMSVDTRRIMEFIVSSWFIISCPIQFLLIFLLLYQEMGSAVFVGLCIITVSFPLNVVSMIFIYRFSNIELKWKDKRIMILTEILDSVKVLKMYAWEKYFLTKVTEIRNKELKCIFRVLILNAVITNIVYNILPFFVLFSTFLTFVNQGGGNVISTELVFVSLSLFFLLRSPIYIMLLSFIGSISAFVSLKRIGDFLIEEELRNEDGRYLKYSTEEDVKESTFSDDTAVEIKDGCFSWKKDETIFLNKINMKIPKGKLVAIIGKVGTGKSSLISAILGEMHITNGFVKIKGSVAYVPQEAWIQNRSLKENILFTKEYNKNFYEKVLKACSLEKDLEQLPGRDETEIGERGINLSGGQKQRVSLARAVYQNRDLYLFDDPLSAVDVNVGQHLFDNVISNKGILSGKTRILVTNGINCLRKVDEVLVLDSNGNISERGSFKELLKTGEEFMMFIKSNMNSNKYYSDIINVFDPQGISCEPCEMFSGKERLSSNYIPEDFLEGSTPQKDNQIAVSSNENVASLSRFSSQIFLSKTCKKGLSGEITNFGSSYLHKDSLGKPLSQLTEDEEAISTTVQWKAYLMYIRSRGFSLFTVTILMYMFFIGVQIFSNIWLAAFSTDQFVLNASLEILRNRSNFKAVQIMQEQARFYLFIYAYIGVGMTMTACVYATCNNVGSIQASKVIHESLLFSILRSPMRFFEANPSGRIVNKFGSDMELIDHSIHSNVAIVIFIFFMNVGSVVLVIYVTPWFVLWTIPLILLYCLVQLFYLPTSRQCRRLESIASIHILSNFTETLQGISVIRAFDEQGNFQKLNEKLIDKSSKCKFIENSSLRWMMLRIEILGVLVVFGSVLFAVIDRDNINVGLIGLSISCSLPVIEMLGLGLRQFSDLETNSESLEYIRKYIQVPSEAKWESDSKPSKSWPELGNVEFENYDLRYRSNLPLALKKINLYLKGGEKIGIVGRTCAGKSSLIFGLFRLAEAAGGNIKIDGIDISSLGLHDLRKSLTILPQEPMIFSGTIRDNLDPLGLYSEEELNQSLEASYLKQWVSTLVEGMQYECGEGGQNLSAGQRKLLCLARAVLRRSNVIILDEATSSIDVETERLVMQTIKELFRESTVIIIAHRIDTIMDMDKVVFVEDGEIVEVGDPQRLLSIATSRFRSLYEQGHKNDLS